jgi:hypothetical protein
MNSDQMPARRIGEGWSSIRGLLGSYSTQYIKRILGKAGMPIVEFQYQGTYKEPLLAEADVWVRKSDDDRRDRLVVGCVEEIVAFEDEANNRRTKQQMEPETGLLRDLEQVLSRLGYGISGKTVFPLRLQLDLETTSLPVEVSEAIAEALRRYRDGKYAGAITSVCGAVDKITESLFLEKNLGDPKATAYQARVSTAFATLELEYCEPLRTKGVVANEVKLVWENHKKAVSQAAYVLATFRREYSDAHGGQDAPAEFVQKALDCAVFILRSFCGLGVGKGAHR